MNISSPIRVLIADDVATIRKLIKGQLEEMGFDEIIECSDGLKAWTLLSQDQNRDLQVHFIVADWNMPHITGFQLLLNLRETEWGKNIPFLMLTSENDREQVAAAVQAGVSQYLIKPFTGKSFTEKFTQAWRKHTVKK